jgi:hypothetical protein
VGKEKRPVLFSAKTVRYPFIRIDQQACPLPLEDLAEQYPCPLVCSTCEDRASTLKRSAFVRMLAKNKKIALAQIERINNEHALKTCLRSIKTFLK